MDEKKIKLDEKKLIFTVISVLISACLVIIALYLKNYYFLFVVMIIIGVWRVLGASTKLGDKFY